MKKISMFLMVLLAALAFAACGDANADADSADSGAVIVEPSVDQLEGDATIPVDINTNASGDGMIKVVCYSDCVYDAVDISQLKEGDTLIASNGTLTVETIEDSNGYLNINGGLEEGGATLKSNDGGTYVEQLLDDYIYKEELGEREYPLSKDVVLTDSSDLESDPVVYTGLEEVEKALQDIGVFNVYNTTIVVENGEVIEINLVYCP